MTSAAPPPNTPTKKTRWWLVLLVVFGVIGGLLTLLVGGVAWWIHANKDRLLAMGREADEASTAYAAGHDQSACVDEGLRRTQTCDGVMCESQTQLFVKMCIQKATPTAGFCDKVPPSSEIMKTVRWMQDECERRGKKADDQRCSRLMQAVPQACHPPQ